MVEAAIAGIQNRPGAEGLSPLRECGTKKPRSLVPQNETAWRSSGAQANVAQVINQSAGGVAAQLFRLALKQRKRFKLRVELLGFGDGINRRELLIRDRIVALRLLLRRRVCRSLFRRAAIQRSRQSKLDRRAFQGIVLGSLDAAFVE